MPDVQVLETLLFKKKNYIMNELINQEFLELFTHNWKFEISFWIYIPTRLYNWKKYAWSNHITFWVYEIWYVCHFHIFNCGWLDATLDEFDNYVVMTQRHSDHLCALPTHHRSWKNKNLWHCKCIFISSVILIVY